MWLEKTTFKSYNGDIALVEFTCENCGCRRFYRPKKQYGLTFLEGFFLCLRCKSQHSYFSDSFIVTYQTQLQLF